MRQKTRKVNFSGKKRRLALIVSRFNEAICEGLLRGAIKSLKEVGFGEKDFQVFRVPGAFEISLAAQAVARSKKFDGIICLGAVIRGETPHFEYVCQAVTEGVNRVMLDSRLPVAFGVLTTDNAKQASERSEDDEFNKGREVALAVLEMIDLLNKLKRNK